MDEILGTHRPCNQHRPHRARNLRPPDCDQITPIAPAGPATARTRRRTVPGGL